jgi:hypothetical protein
MSASTTTASASLPTTGAAVTAATSAASTPFTASALDASTITVAADTDVATPYYADQRRKARRSSFIPSGIASSIQAQDDAGGAQAHSS